MGRWQSYEEVKRFTSSLEGARITQGRLLMDISREGQRVAIVAGLRTPFAKQSTAYADLEPLELGTLVVAELLQRTGVAPSLIDEVVFGQVIPSVQAPNIAREVVLNTDIPDTTQAYSVSRACATGLQAAVNVAQSIALGASRCGVAGGAESLSSVPVTVSKALAKALMRFAAAKTPRDKLAAFRDLGAKDFVPVPPAIKERSTGLTMGQSAEYMAKVNHISREAQDAFAHRSHALAAKAWADGKFDDDVMPVYVPPIFRKSIRKDNLVREDSEVGAYGKLRPVFDRKYGSITAGNASPLTDGASALLLMREDVAKAEGYKPLGFLKSFAFVAVDPKDQLLLGPAFAVPKALDAVGMTLKDIGVLDMHEAFAAQVLSNTQALESDKFARERLGRSSKVGEIDWDAFNPVGGSIALGHPFAATGARQIIHALRELHARQSQHALCTACAAGGLGAALILEAA